MRIEDSYNIHCFLYDILHIGKHHFKSKLLCKSGLHNYQIRNKRIPLEPEIYQEKGVTITRNRFDWKIYWKCYCCGKEEKIED